MVGVPVGNHFEKLPGRLADVEVVSLQRNDELTPRHLLQLHVTLGVHFQQELDEVRPKGSVQI